ncbi:arginine/serine-rich coiled-coil protein 2 isoform X2 [Benincasa hispida]|uniref:arginine/serine-rich coiled-coil protein 2 isoform X2 n=1 Tax=Benincasa hispida TaxID=102211 RepID=UPI0019015B73|nr:arginine/serine-rich coiled-coil protein 2 isoform X2 [Benincasa hispida]
MENNGMKAEFRKPSSETTGRKYRRRSSVSGSSSSDESPKRDRSSSPKLLKDVASKDSERKPRRKEDERDLNKDSRNHHSRSSDSYRYSDRKSSRSSHGYSRHDDYARHDKYADEERDYERLSSRSSRESKGGAHYDHARRESEHFHSREYFRDVEKSSRDKYDGSGHRSRDGDSLSERHGFGNRRHVNSEEIEKHRNTRDRDGRDEKRDNMKHSGDYKNERVLSHDNPKGNRYDLILGRDESKHRTKEIHKSDRKDLDDEKFAKEERKHDARETNWDKGQGKESKGKYDGKGVFVDENQGLPAKKPKLFSLGKEVNHEEDAEENQSSTSKQDQDGKMSVGLGQSGDSDFAADFSAAKVAAMKAAELVNKNLVGVGYMTTDQKKKLLWGSKKSTAVEESGHHWDTALFTDRERQEKFNKLMSLRLPWCLWPIVGCEGRAEDGAPTDQPRWQRTSPGRKAKGTPDGFRKTIHCWTSKKRWSNCWIRSLSVFIIWLWLFLWFDEIVMRIFSLCCCTRVVLNVLSTTFNSMFLPSLPHLKTIGLWPCAFTKVRKSSGCLQSLNLLASFISEFQFLVSTSLQEVMDTFEFLVKF